MNFSADTKQSFRIKTEQPVYRFLRWRLEICPARLSSFRSILLPDLNRTLFNDLSKLQEQVDLLEELGQFDNGYRPSKPEWDNGDGRDDYFVIATGEEKRPNGLHINRRSGNIDLCRFTFDREQVIAPNGWRYVSELDPRYRFLGRIPTRR